MQVAHFDTQHPLEEVDNLIHRLNNFLPKSIAVYNLKKVLADSHARFDALQRVYEYHIATKKDPFLNGFCYFINYSLDIKKMNKAAKILYQYGDFQCFSKTKTDVKTFLCEIKYARWKETSFGYVFTISANRFLRNMVRAIVGTFLEIGIGKRSVKSLHDVIQSKSRSSSGYSVPAEGLYLTEIKYAKKIYC